MATAYLGLGSNLDNPKDQIREALRALVKHPNIEVDQVSSLFQSRAIGPGVQPDYINAIARISTTLSPQNLLQTLQLFEQQQGRIRSVRWEARTLDLDILLYDNLVLQGETLTLPHPRMTERNFVLYPLYEIAPELTLPTGETLSELLAKCPTQGIVKITDG